MRSYGQFCALARGLDVIGDRWSLLVVRELLLGPQRYTDLLHGLPGVATNLLADRLRSLEEAGVLAQASDGAYELTPWGQGLADPIHAIARWSVPLMAAPAGDATFRSHWISHPVDVLFEGVDRRRPTLTVEVRSGEEPMTIRSAGGEVKVHPGPAEKPDITLQGSPDAILGLLAGVLGPGEAADRGVVIKGDARRLTKLRPRLPVDLP